MKRRLTVLLAGLCLLLTLTPWTSAASAPKLAALTFDDGPGAYTARLLDGLRERGVHATFFCLGSRAEQYPDLIQRMMDEGHQVANHSYDHPNLNALGVETALKQLTRTDSILNDATGGTGAYYYRAPYGNSTEALRSRLDAPLIYWSVDTLDWQSRNAEKVSAKIRQEIFDGAILLLHDIHPTSVDGVLDAVDKLRDHGYEFVTVKELFRRRGVTPEAGVQYYSCKPNGADLAALTAPELALSRNGDTVEVTLSSADGVPIYYTIDGAPVTYESSCYAEPFFVSLPCTIRAVSAWDLNGGRSVETMKTMTLPPAGEPEARLENGKVYLTPSADGETVWYAMGDNDVLTEGAACSGPLDLTPDTWFSYYAGGSGLMHTEPRRLLYTAEGNLFADVAQDSWYYPVLDEAVSKGYLQGTGAFTLSPQGTVTRGMLAVMLYRFAGEPEVSGQSPFDDVAEDAYFAVAVAWGYENKIFSGVSAEAFAPDKPVTRQELAKILAAYVQADPAEVETAYADGGSVADWAAEAVQAVTELGLMQGSGGFFRPLASTTRAEAAAVLLRLEQFR